MSLEINKVHQIDVLEFTSQIGDDVADMIFADPPYNIKSRGGRFSENVHDWQNYFTWCRDWMAEAKRILKPCGSFFIKCPARTSGRFQVIADDLDLHYRNQIIVSVPVHPTRKSFLTSHEIILYYAKDKSRVYFNPTAEYIPHDVKKPWWHKEKFRAEEGDRVSDIWTDIKWVPGGCLTNGETILKENSMLKAHPNQMSIKIAQRAILFTTRPYNLVVDLFAGSGTVPAACAEYNRYYLACDINSEYVHLANVRAGQEIFNFDPNRENVSKTASQEAHSEEIARQGDLLHG